MKQENDPRHPMFGYIPQRPRLSSLTEDLCKHIKEEPAVGYHLSYATWKALNRLMTGMSRCKVNLKKWGYIAGDKLCECEERQDTHIFWSVRASRIHTQWKICMQLMAGPYRWLNSRPH
ncbi:hypothetical protein PR048_010740, partial [Dryococelus australis]